MTTNESLQAFLASGKVDIGFEVGDGYVTGVCLLYQSRADQEHEFMIREKSIAIIGNRGLSECVQDAKDFAYQSAICRLDGNSAAFAAPVAQEAPTPGSVLTDKEQGDAPAQTEEQQGGTHEKAAAPSTAQSAYTPPVSGEPDGGNPAFDDLQEEDDGSGDITDFENGGEDGEDGEEQGGGVQRFDLSSLKPASSLLDGAPAASRSAPDEVVDPAMQKALAMKITILGKYHESFGKTAGEILETDPQCIVDFAHRYTGPKVEEKEALVMLYPEALRRVQAAA